VIRIENSVNTIIDHKGTKTQRREFFAFQLLTFVKKSKM